MRRAMRWIPVMLILVACGKDSTATCGNDEELQDGVCVKKQVDPGPCDGVVVELATGMGQTCTADSECPSTASYCAIRPGYEGFCTYTGCKNGPPSCCPAQWACVDLATFSPGLPSICNKP